MTEKRWNVQRDIPEVGNEYQGGGGTLPGSWRPIDVHLSPSGYAKLPGAQEDLSTKFDGNKLCFESYRSLRTIDRIKKFSLFPSGFLANSAPVKTAAKILHKLPSSFLMTLDDVLDAVECRHIMKSHQRPASQDFRQYQRPSRLITLDENCAQLLWDRIREKVEQALDRSNFRVQPLGFCSSQRNWQLAGINNAIRINEYSEEKQRFQAHRDAQFVKDWKCRSLFSIVIYLNDVDDGAETVFHVPKWEDPVYGVPELLTIKQEMSQAGFHKSHRVLKVKPKLGKAVVFTHNLIHSSEPAKLEKKAVLRSEILVRTDDKPELSCRAEYEDLMTCMRLFRKAEVYEVNDFSECNELYEKSMYLRYMYPRALRAMRVQYLGHLDFSTSILGKLMAIPELFGRMFQFCDAKTQLFLSFHFDQVKQLMHGNDQIMDKAADRAKLNDRINIVNIDRVDRPAQLIFQAQLTSSVEELTRHIDGWCRVFAMLLLYLETHRFPRDAEGFERSKFCARYIPETNQVIATSLNRLLYDAFHMNACYGSFYAVRDMDYSSDVDIRNAFEACVERSHIRRSYNVEHVGENYAAQTFVSGSWDTGYIPGMEFNHSVHGESDYRLGIGYVCEFDVEAGFSSFASSDTAEKGVVIQDPDEAPEADTARVLNVNQLIFDFLNQEMVVSKNNNDNDLLSYVIVIKGLEKTSTPFYHAATQYDYVDVDYFAKCSQREQSSSLNLIIKFDVSRAPDIKVRFGRSPVGFDD